MNEGQNVIKEALRLDSTSVPTTVGGVGLRPSLDAVVNGPASYPAVDSAILSSPNSRQPVSDAGRNRRPLIGQGAMNANDMPAPAAANFGALPQNVVAAAPMGRPIVKGNVVQEFSA